MNGLKKYLRSTDTSEASFGAKVGAAQQTVHSWAAGISIPRKAEMQRIYTVTAGAVQPNDFYDLPDLAEVAEVAA